MKIIEMFNGTKNKILVTGGAGFIGSNFVNYLFNNILYDDMETEIHVIDSLTYAGKWKNISEWENHVRFTFTQLDITDRETLENFIFENNYTHCVHFAAESHVDNSIKEPGKFINTNIVGTFNLLEIFKRKGIEKFIYISTDEVYGSIKNGSFTEESNLNPSSPYSASKAAGDLLINSFIKTYSFPGVIIRPCNNYGRNQNPEKLIPKTIISFLKDEKISVYGNGFYYRDWIFVNDTCKAILSVLEKGETGEIYNISTGKEYNNQEIIFRIYEIIKTYKKVKSFNDSLNFVEDRPGHDFRYSMDSSKIKTLGWGPETDIQTGLELTVQYYITEMKRGNL